MNPPPGYPPIAPPAGTRLAAGCGGALLGVALTGGLGAAFLYLWTKQAADQVRNDPGFAGFGVAIGLIYGVIALVIVSLIVGCVSGAVCVAAANRLGKVPVTSMLGFPLFGMLVVWMVSSVGGFVLLPWNVSPSNLGPIRSSRQPRSLPPPASQPSAAPPVYSPKDGRTSDHSPANDGISYARPERKLTVEEMKEYARQAEADAPSVLGDWLYPGARAIAFTPRPGEIKYPLLGLQTTDSFDSVVAFYEKLAPGGAKQDDIYLLHGARPSDGRQTEIRISTYKDKTFVRFDSR